MTTRRVEVICVACICHLHPISIGYHMTAVDQYLWIFAVGRILEHMPLTSLQVERGTSEGQETTQFLPACNCSHKNIDALETRRVKRDNWWNTLNTGSASMGMLKLNYPQKISCLRLILEALETREKKIYSFLVSFLPIIMTSHSQTSCGPCVRTLVIWLHLNSF